MIYVDSSVALAHLAVEPRSPPESLWAESLVSSKLLEYEVWNRIHVYRLTDTLGENAGNLLALVDMVEMTRLVLARASAPFPIAVRTLDGLHLATAVFLNAVSDPVLLASYDARMLNAARALGIELAVL